MIDFDGPVPAYRQLAGIDRAVDVLREEGVLETVLGKGLFVSRTTRS